MKRTPTSNRLYVENTFLKSKESIQSLKAHFSPFGTITNMEITKTKRCCFISFSSSEEATKAMTSLNNKMIDSRIITIQYAQPSEEQPKVQPKEKPNTSNETNGSNSSNSSSKVTVVKYKVPLESFFFNKTIVIELDGKQYQIQLTANIRSGSQFRIATDSQNDGSQKETIVELEMEQNEMFEKWE